MLLRTTNNKEKGEIGEEFAKSLYQKAKFEIVETNLRMGRNQVDLVVKRDDIYCFVEVKFRQTIAAAHAAITRAQLGRIAQTAAHYMHGRDNPWQIDALLIDARMSWQRIDNIDFAMHINSNNYG